jgi:hypothetical protein
VRRRPATARRTPRTPRFAALALLAWGIAALACGEPPRGAAGPVPDRPPAPVTEALPGDRYDLGPDERLGGHTLARHVGRTPDELAARLAAERGLRAASTFPDRATAERAVALALATQRDRVDRWIARGPRRPNLALTVRSPGGRPFGLTLARGEGDPREARAARVVLRARGDAFYVLTAYPTEER